MVNKYEINLFHEGAILFLPSYTNHITTMVGEGWDLNINGGLISWSCNISWLS